MCKIDPTYSSKNCKHLGINLIKDVKDLKNENCKTLRYNMSDNIKSRKLLSWIGIINIIKMCILPSDFQIRCDPK